MKKKYPDLFYNYALSGKAMCHACNRIINQEHYVYVFQGNVYHDICSEQFKERERIDR